ncbi:GNAT family N-acetyltransferase [Micromonospora echinofusca]|uniref:GNAT family N-acetyltransferase n=1 Tax=Micromonospora echinofusca TaxID=47858 RepID=A0ABS3VZI7_MICEH|nr:GNAT family N-acetyltransferase [Micromonospora echinofusca]MBO4209939.1 GNAT family N-acetyltransferase [Micromonospora echinofusca]
MQSDLSIRPVRPDDLAVFFRMQLDPEANRMAAFTAPDPADRVAFDRHWDRVLADPRNRAWAVVVDGTVVGNVLSFPVDDTVEVSYWIDRPHWGRGHATAALTALLREVTVRPLHARAAKDNLGSLSVLRKCGFVVCGEDRAYAEARGTEVEEYVLTLPA